MVRSKYVGKGVYEYRGMYYTVSCDSYTPIYKQHKDEQDFIDKHLDAHHDNVESGIPADVCLRKYFDEIGD